MKGVFKRVPFVISLLLLVGIITGGYFYYHNHYMDAANIVKRALRNEKKLKSYFASLEVSPAEYETEQRYFVQLWFLAPASFRVEIFSSYLGDGPPEQVFISDGASRWIYNPEIGDYLLINPLTGDEMSSSPFLLTAFLKELSRACQVELLGLDKHEDRSYYLLQVIPQHRAREHAWEKVWLEKRSMLPVKIQVFDEHDRLVRTVTYKKIDLNPSLNEELFRIDAVMT